MTLSYRSLLYFLCLGVMTQLIFVGCGDDADGGEEGPGEEVVCDPGFVAVGTECRELRPSNNDPANNDPTNNDPTNNDPTNNDPTNNDPNNRPDGPCITGQSVCVDNETVSRCTDPDNGGWTDQRCTAPTSCIDGACRTESSCEPGAVRGCTDQFSQSVCNADGNGTEARVCEGGLYCVAGQCLDRLCEEGRMSCRDGNIVTVCNADGSGFDDVETCPATSTCDGGECQSLCDANKKVASYLGCEYWTADLPNLAHSNPGSASLATAVVISNPNDVPAEIVIVRADGVPFTFPDPSVAAGALKVIDMPIDRRIDGSGVFTSHAWKVTSSVPITVHQFNPLNGENVFTNDASLLLPINATGQEYIVMAWPQRVDQDQFGTYITQGYATVIAVEPGDTEVTVDASAIVDAGDGLPGGIAEGGSQTITLSEGEVLNIATGGEMSGPDLTGTVITANQNIAVFGGHECANVPNPSTAYCDHLEQQLFPVASWSNRVFVTPFSQRSTSQTDRIVIMAAEDGTQIQTTPPQSFDGVVLERGQNIQIDTSRPFQINASGPIMVGQFLHGSNYPGFRGHASCGFGRSGIGDPAFTLEVPVAQYRDSYVVLTPPGYLENYLNVIIPDGATVTVDGTAVPTVVPISGTGFGYAEVLVAEGVHEVSGTSPFGLVAYGYDCDVSYAYPGGLNLEAIP